MKRLKKVVLCPNPARDDGLCTTFKVMEILNKIGVPYSVSPLFMPDIMPQLPAEIKYVSGSEALCDAGLVIAFGGDGTILHSAREASKFDVPVLSINMGRTGFMAELESVDEEKIIRAVSGDFIVEKRMMLDLVLRRNEETIYCNFALNDIVVSKGGTAKIIDVSVFGDDKKIAEFYGDGVIISTPTGSTGYSMSAGGPIVEPSAESIIITPICAHSLSAKSFVLARDRVVSLRLGPLSDRKAHLSVDGGGAIEIKGHDVITAKLSERKASLARLSDRSFYETINSKFDVKGCGG